MKISEIFYSIEGEGIEIGRPQIFVRLAGCNLRCNWCDTKYALEEGKEMDVPSLNEKVSSFPCKNVSITGGEPLLQKQELLQFVKCLKKANYWVQVNTNGTLYDEELFELVDLISMDCKCPSSEMNSEDDVLRKTLKLFNSKAQFKFVIATIKDYEFAIEKISVTLKGAKNIIFQPEWENRDFAKNLALLIKKTGCDIKLILQQHKIIWGNERGV